MSCRKHMKREKQQHMGETSIRSWLVVIMTIIGLNMVVLVIVKANNVSNISCPFPPCSPPSALSPCRFVLRSPLINDGKIKKYQKRGRFGKSGTFKYCIKWAKKHCNKKASSNENYKNCFSRRLAECMRQFLSEEISPQL